MEENWEGLGVLGEERLVDQGVELFATVLAGRRFSITQDREARKRPARWATGSAATEAHALTGAVLWDGAVVVAGILEHAPAGSGLAPCQKRVVELGCGFTALPGLLAAALGAVSVCVTDVIEVIDSPQLLANLNANLDAAERDRVSRCVCLWGEPIGAEMQSADLLICSDCVYDLALIAPLLDTITAVLQAGAVGCSALVAFDRSIRRVATYAEFERRCRERFGTFEPVGSTQRHPKQDSESVSVFVLRL
jgi:predicted nicotinamide N-methyase